ncbi:restriction endonuclease subunit S [Chitinibacter sp. FCG-7]|uniref:Restriction endonuclease subunit S n=1 Tax=Chitinibacter mangrovi TaxID=3153927 RepID=A0AAU7F8M8_9NEIS
MTKTLGEVCSFDKVQSIHCGLPYVGLEHIESHTARFIGSSEPQPVKSSTFRFSNEHVLYGRLRPYLNKVLAPDFDGHCSTEIFPLKPCSELSRSYLLFWLLADTTCERINATCTGARMPRAQMNDVLGFEIPIPPLAEQQRIVAILDEAFEGIATAKANAEKNLQNARALFESNLQLIFTSKGEGWTEKTIGELAKHSLGKMLDKAKNQGEMQPYLRNINVRWFDFDLSDVLEMRFLETEVEKYTAVKGDVLICEGGYPGRCAIWEKDEPIFFQKALHRVRFHEQNLNQWFVYYLFLLDKTGGLKQYFTGSGIQHLTGEALKRFKLPAPPLAQLPALLEHIDQLAVETQRLEAIYQQKLAALDELKKALLQQAFSGEL